MKEQIKAPKIELSKEEGGPTLSNTSGSTPYNATRTLRQRNMAQIKQQIKMPEKELSDKEIANLSDAEFKTLVIRMLTEMVEYGHKIEERVKATQSEIKKNIQGTTSEGKDTRTQINDLEQKGEINIQPEQNEETKIQKLEERFRNLQDNFKHSNIWIIGVPEEEEVQDIENLFEKIMKENFPILAKEIDFQEFQEAQRVSKKLDPMKHTPGHIICLLYTSPSPRD